MEYITYELTDVGYNHIPKGANRDIKIARAMQTRQVGTKLPPPYPNGWFALAESRDLKIGGVVSVDALAPKGISIKTWQTVEAEGAIWVWYDAEGRSPLWSVNGPGHVRLRLETGFGPVLISQSVTPIGVLQQRVVHRIYSPWYNAVIAAAFVPGESYMELPDVGFNHIPKGANRDIKVARALQTRQELTDVGYNHIPKGANRDIKIARAMQTRQVGTKLPPPYPNGWFALAESRDLKIGGVVSVDALVYRGEDGVARCVDAYCPHLGANLGVGGTVSGGCIECPFHKWRFDDGGACTVEAEGAIWVWYDAEGRSPLWSVVSPEEEEELKGWGYRGRNEFVVGSHIMPYPMANGQHTWAAEWLRGEGHTARINLTHRYKFGKLSVFQINIVADQNGPGHVRLRLETGFGPVLISQSVTPIGVLQQRVCTGYTSPWYNAVIAAAFCAWRELYVRTGHGYMEQ
ncbi:hypothetical protein MSG28_016231 [Choristoneura fumiferana]|uniref:Uncharacterized protein n=1 Tax=Choristoneura fumiferana TaxID=7141 RepID=A0ACC0K6G7_CHOFU|nr:hypothetical protein MSG28_016231 [Choristoneura fumiferana]